MKAVKRNAWTNRDG